MTNGSLEPVLLYERCLLGALIMASDTRAALAQVDAMLPACVMSPSHQPVLEALRGIAVKGKDGNLVNVCAELSARGDLEKVGGHDRMMALVEECPDINGLEKYARSIMEYRNRQQAQVLAASITRKIVKGEPLDGDIEKLSSVTKGGDFAAKPPDWKEITQSEIFPLSALVGLVDVKVDYLLKPALIKGCLTQIHGSPKGGKSVFALYTSLSVAIGSWTGGLWDYIPMQPKNVLYISFEDSPLLIIKRAFTYLNGMGYDGRAMPSNFFLCDNPTLMMDTAQGNQLLRDKIKELAIDLVVIDTLSYIHQAEDENASADLKPLMSNLKRIVRDMKISIFYVHHSRKGQGDPQNLSSAVDRARGTSVISAAADVILDWGNREPGTHVTPVKFISKYDEGYEFSVTYSPAPEEEAVRWHLDRNETEAIEKEKRPGPTENAKSVLDTLKAIALQGYIDVPGRDILKIMSDQGMSKTTLNRTLHKLVEDNSISATPQGNGNTTLYRVLNNTQTTGNPT